MKRTSITYAAAAIAVSATMTAASSAKAAEPFVDRPITLPRLVFAGDVGLGLGHAHFGNRDFFGPGINLEGVVGISGLVHLQRSKSLREVNLSGTKVTEAGVRALRKALPKASIKH